MTDIKTLLEQEKNDLLALLPNLTTNTERVRELAAKAFDLSAMILSAKLVGQDTAVAEASLRGIRDNLTAASSITATSAVSSHINGSLLRVAGWAAQVLLAV